MFCSDKEKFDNIKAEIKKIIDNGDPQNLKENMQAMYKVLGKGLNY